MTVSRIKSIAAAAALTLGVTFVPAIAAQDAMINCSSDLVLNLYVAERYFGFGGMRSMMMDDGMEMVDLATIDRGQFAPLFESMMGMMDENMMMPGMTMMDETMMESMSEMMMMDDAAMMESMGMEMDDMTMLTPMMMEGEDATCSSLRAELTRFFTAVVVNDAQMGMGMMDMDMEMTDTAEMGMMSPGYTATLSGIQETPGLGDEDATGIANFTIDAATNEICWDVTVENVALPMAAAHIHVGAAGVAGDVVVPLSAPDADGVASGCTIADAAIVADIIADPVGFYANFHNADFPGGALRGQLIAN